MEMYIPLSLRNSDHGKIGRRRAGATTQTVDEGRVRPSATQTGSSVVPVSQGDDRTFCEDIGISPEYAYTAYDTNRHQHRRGPRGGPADHKRP